MLNVVAYGEQISIYDELQLKRVINANATLTRLGGSRMPPPVVEAMDRAAEAFVDLDEMQQRVGSASRR